MSSKAKRPADAETLSSPNAKKQRHEDTKMTDAKSQSHPASPVPSDGYGWEKIHEDFNNGKYAGVYGGCNAAWHGLAEIRAGVDLSQFHKKRSKDEFIPAEIEDHIKNNMTRRRWNDIVSLDPLGIYAAPPTMAAVHSSIMIPELKFEVDGKIVNSDGSANVLKLAIDYVWDIPRFAKRLKMDEKRVRQALAKYCQNERVLDEKTRIFLPPVGGVTVYTFGDLRHLNDESCEIALRVHDSCAGSDVFGTDICTCRPYLVFALKAAVECAQRGGVGMIIYFQKEGRSLGEVTKFRVYNARKAQEGGDSAEKYFYQTESIAGIRDARFQEVMPDVFRFLGIDRIDWLLSMSSDKYDAIVEGGVQVMQRVPLPDIYVPRNAHVEISAKIAAGYHSVDVKSDDVIADLRSLEKIRARCNQIYDLAKAGKTKFFKLNLGKLDECANYVIDYTKKSYPELKIPYHSRWRHFQPEAVSSMIENWPCDDLEKSRRMIDLVTISVLLDAGAGPSYHYVDQDGLTRTRSEGLAVATLELFKEGIFSSDVCVPHRVNSQGLRSLTWHAFEKGFQLSKANVMVGAKSRFKLLQRLSDALEARPDFFGKEVYRPGNILDYAIKHATEDKKISVRTIWRPVIEGFESIWPENSSGVRRGDVHVYNPLKKNGVPASDMVPFHKLSQWLTYSLLEPIERLGYKITDLDLLTGLAEYRNGGLFVDSDVLIPTAPNVSKLHWDIGSELVVEWRALTVCLLDELADRIRKVLKMDKDSLPLAKVLQGGTWAAGRALASQKRKDGSAPIQVRSDGTVF